MQGKRLSIWAAATVAGVLLAGCSGSETGVASLDDPPSAAVTTDVPAAAQEYADCLRGEGVENIVVDPDGGVYLGQTSDASTGSSGETTGELDDAAVELYEKATATCRAKVPDYAPPADSEPTATSDQLAAAVAFAGCARENGFGSWPDPGQAADLEVPSGTTTEQFKALLEACGKELAPTPDANGAISYTSPNFTGAFQAEWAVFIDELLMADIEDVQ